MKIKIFVTIISIILVISYITRLIYINNKTFAPKIITYSIGEEVPIEDDFFDSSFEKMNGYSLTVTDTKIVSIDEFKSEYSEFKNQMNAEYICLVKVTFRNNDNAFGEGAGINLEQYMIQEKSYINLPDKEAFRLINGFDSLMFSLRLNSEKELIIPFDINTDYIDIKKIKSGNTSLVVSLYPHKKVISFLSMWRQISQPVNVFREGKNIL